MLQRRAFDPFQERLGGHKISKKRVTDEEDDQCKDRMLHCLADKEPGCHALLIILSSFQGRTFKKLFYRSDQPLDKNGLGTGIATPDTSPKTRHPGQEQGCSEQHKDEIKTIREAKGLTHHVHNARGNVKTQQRQALNCHKRYQQVHGDQEQSEQAAISRSTTRAAFWINPTPLTLTVD
ncbi:hypothetical protein DAPPUDRAFT_272199, partial [Daphnia pulex]